MRVTNITEAKAQLSRLVEAVLAGEKVIIARSGKPVAILTAYEPDAAPRPLGGSWEGRVIISDDFDELPPEIERALSGREE